MPSSASSPDPNEIKRFSDHRDKRGIFSRQGLGLPPLVDRSEPDRQTAALELGLNPDTATWEEIDTSYRKHLEELGKKLSAQEIDRLTRTFPQPQIRKLMHGEGTKPDSFL